MKEVESYKADVVILMFGYNDAKESIGNWKNPAVFYNEYAKIIKRL